MTDSFNDLDTLAGLYPGTYARVVIQSKTEPDKRKIVFVSEQGYEAMGEYVRKHELLATDNFNDGKPVKEWL